MTDAEFIIDARYSAQLLGTGSYGIVVSATDSRTAARVAIKKLLSPFANAHLTRHVLREIRLLRHLRHPHIVRLLDLDVPPSYAAWDAVYLVTPLLSTHLRSALLDGTLDNPADQKRVAFQLLLALEHMHAVGVMHRDVKARNLLLDEELNLQLCDLGESRFHSRANRDVRIDGGTAPALEPQLSGAIGTVIQSAPELALGGEYDAEVDIWAAGCVIAEMVHPRHETLFDGTSKPSHVREIIEVVWYPSDDMLDVLSDFAVRYLERYRGAGARGNRVGELLGPTAGRVVVDLLEKMLRFFPKERVSARTALSHGWFDEVRSECGVETEGAVYDFALSEPPRKVSKAELKRLIWEEVVAFHPEAASLAQ